MKTIVIAVLALTIGAVSVGWSAEPSPPAYVPGMGEIMGATQMRHAKLWFAGQAGNWDLAQYELDEIHEGFEDAVTYHPVFKNDAQIAQILEKFVAVPLHELESAVSAKKRPAFIRAYDHLTAACNQCHQAAGQGFIRIKRPSGRAFDNQDFTVWVR